MRRPSEDLTDLGFRLLFSSIFVGLGGEHLFSDELISRLMPLWMPAPRMCSILAGLVLTVGGVSLVVGYRVRQAAVLLGSFLVAVTVLVHAPALLGGSPPMPPGWDWMWVILQRSNFVKNLCLLGVCLHLLHYQPRRWSLDGWLQRRRDQPQR